MRGCCQYLRARRSALLIILKTIKAAKAALIILQIEGLTLVILGRQIITALINAPAFSGFTSGVMPWQG